INIELLFCTHCLNPTNLFSSFDREKLIDFVKFYPHDSSLICLVMFDNQLDIYVILTMDLLISTIIIERTFSIMKIVKNRLFNRMCDTWTNDSPVHLY
ncbi:hypothetical protein Lal_00039492, partial [Lupinus albus]